MLNEARFIGNAVKDVQVFEKNGIKFAVTSLAVDNSYTNKNGQKVEDVLFIDLYFNGGYMEVAKKYITKGKKLFVGGTLKFKPYTTPKGDKAFKYYISVDNIEFLSPKNVQNAPSSETPSTPKEVPQEPSSQTHNSEIPSINVNDDEIPF